MYLLSANIDKNKHSDTYSIHIKIYSLIVTIRKKVGSQFGDKTMYNKNVGLHS